MRGRNRCDLNSAWATGVAYGRFYNLHQRHGDLLKMVPAGLIRGAAQKAIDDLWGGIEQKLRGG